MNLKKFAILFVGIFVTFFLSSCSYLTNPFGENNPQLFPIRQNNKWGYINGKGEVIIQPQFQAAYLFSEGLAPVCSEFRKKCGYIDQTGKFIINPQFEGATRFSDGLAAVVVDRKIGYIDKTGKFIIHPQYEGSAASTFSEGLALVLANSKPVFIDKTGRIVIDNPQFQPVTPFFEGLAVVANGDKDNSKFGFIDKEGKIVINPQFDHAEPFSNGLAVVRMDKKFGYIDKSGKVVISPKFTGALPFSDDGFAGVLESQKVGFIDKSGNYVITPQFGARGKRTGDEWLSIFLFSPEVGRISFSEGLASIQIGEGKDANSGYIDKTGKIIINPQFSAAFPFYNGLALVFLGKNEAGNPTDLDLNEMAWIDKEGKFVWRETKDRPTIP